MMPRASTRSPLRSLGAACLGTAVAASLWLATSAAAQQDNPVYVDDSPQARELLRQARDQTRENVGEAVRLYQELLDEYALKLVPSSDVAGDQFTSTRRRVVAALLADQNLLQRYRLAQTPAAEQRLQAGDLIGVATSYVLTEPGLEAMLRLAQRELEGGRFHSALLWLQQSQEHPDFVGRRAAHGLYMTALCRHDLGDDARAKSARDSMRNLGADAEPFDRELEALFGDQRPPANVGVGVLDEGPQPALTDVVAQPIWSVPLDDSLFRRRLRAITDSEDAVNAATNNRGEVRLRDADLATAAVTVVGPLAYINQGHTILSIDRLTGRELWSYQDLSRLGMTEPGGGLDAHDLSMIAVHGDVLVTLTGHAQANRRSDGGRVICIDARDGSLRWSSKLSGIIEAAPDEELFAHGAPVIIEGRVFVMARKVSAQLLTSAYVVALDVRDGSVLWSRHVASSGGLRIAARPFDTLIERDGSLFVASPVGAMARLNAATGEIRWLRRFSVPINTPISDQTRRPWEMAAPVVTSRGMVAIQPDARRVVLLDLDTGDDLGSHSAGTTGDWNSPRYLLSDGDHVFGVGSDIRGFGVDTLEEPSWRVPALALQQSPDDAPLVESLEMRGRVQLADGKLIAPTAGGVLVIDAITGTIEQTLSIDASGNPLAYESQVLLAGSDRLDAYMSMRRAEELLRAQMAAAPDSPEPALSLLRLGIRAGNIALSIEAADKAMAATSAHADDPAFDERRFSGRAELFTLLLDLVRGGADMTLEQGEGVFARLQQAAVGPEQRVEHLLAYGDWLAAPTPPRALPRAMETWQTILSDERLSSVWLTEDQVSRLAGTRALERIGKVIAQRGASAYAPQSDFAALRLTQIRDAAALSGSPDIEALAGIVREFAHAPAAIDATLMIADALSARGDARGALAAIQRLYLAAPAKVAASRLFGRFTDLSVAAGRMEQAAETLMAVRSAWGDLTLDGVSGSQRLSERLADLGSARAARLPTLGNLSGEPIAVGGPVVGAVRGVLGGAHSAARLPTNMALVRDGNSVRLITSEKMEPAWTASLEGAGGGSPQILQFDARTVTLWLPSDPENPRAVRLNVADGAVAWTTPRVSELVPGWGAAGVAGDRVRVAREQMPNGDSFDPTETLAAIDDRTLLLVHRNGQVAAISADDGRTVNWTRTTALQQVHFAALRNGVLVLAGLSNDLEAGAGDRARAAADAQQAPSLLAPRIVVLDARTGSPAFGPDGIIRPSGRAGVKWITVSPLGVLAFGSIEGIEAASLATGERLWKSAAYGTLDTQRAWGMDQRVVVEDQRSRLRTVRLADGAISETFELPLRGEWDPMELRDLIVSGETLIARFGQRIVIFDSESGRVVGADAVAEDRDFRWLVETADQLQAVSVASVTGAINPAGGGVRRTQYQYTTYALSRNGKVIGAPVRTERLPERVQNVTAIDGWLLFSTLTDTLAVPMSGK